MPQNGTPCRSSAAFHEGQTRPKRAAIDCIADRGDEFELAAAIACRGDSGGKVCRTVLHLREVRMHFDFEGTAVVTGGMVSTIAGSILAMKASKTPPYAAWSGLAVGKFVESVPPAT